MTQISVTFETTSLYGSTKSASQYDGLKPIMRYKGLTDSNFTPLLHDHIFKDLNQWFIERNDGKSLVKLDASSRKTEDTTEDDCNNQEVSSFRQSTGVC